MVLSQGKRNIKGAQEYIIENFSRIKKETEIVLIVGSNDLEKSSSEDVIKSMNDLLRVCKDKLSNNKISIMPGFVRLGNTAFNRKLSEYNANLKQLSKDGVTIIDNQEITGCNCCNYFFQSDGIHFTRQGTMALVRILKSHLNVRLGLQPYSSYDNNSQQIHPHNPSNRPSKYRGGHSDYDYRHDRYPYQYGPRPRYERNPRSQFDLKTALSEIINHV